MYLRTKSDNMFLDNIYFLYKQLSSVKIECLPKSDRNFVWHVKNIERLDFHLWRYGNDTRTREEMNTCINQAHKYVVKKNNVQKNYKLCEI